MHSIRQVTMRKTKWISSLLFNRPGGHRHRFFHGDSQRMFTAGCCWRASASSFALVVGGGTVVFSFYDYYRQKQRDIEDQPNASRANSSGWCSSNHPTLMECAPAPPELASTPPPLFSMRNFHGNGNSSFNSDEKNGGNNKNNIGIENEIFDFLIVGHGHAGRSALAELQRACPTATVAVVDPLVNGDDDVFSGTNTGNKNQTNSKRKSSIKYYGGSRAVGLDPVRRVVRVQTNSEVADSGSVIGPSSPQSPPYIRNTRYRHGVLIATGARGAPPPYYLMDGAARNRILELKSTLAAAETTAEATEPVRILAPDQVRQKTLDTVRVATNPESLLISTGGSGSDGGDRVAVLGSGWDAVDLAVTLAKAAAPAKPNEKKTKIAVVLVMGCSGPASHILPSYLSAELCKRMRKYQSGGISVQDRTLVKYIDVSSSTANNSHSGDNGLFLYTAKSYDYLDTDKQHVCEVVLAPETAGARGSAALATNSVPIHLSFLDEPGGLQQQKHGAKRSNTWYQSWSSLIASSGNSGNNKGLQPSPLVCCYKSDSRIVVNTQLAATATADIFAAGSCCAYPNTVTGHVSPTGTSVQDSEESGRVAAHNMSLSYDPKPQQNSENNAAGFGVWNGLEKANTSQHQQHAWMTKDPLPVWRSDILSARSLSNYRRSHLGDIGVTACCVGHCDSEKYNTHGIWWTNHQSVMRQRRSLRQRIKKRKSLLQSYDDDGNEDEQYMLATSTGDYSVGNRRRLSLLNNKKKAKKRKVRPVYGMGVVYYTDQAGNIQGVMTWGLPITTKKEGDSDHLNSQLVEQMKQIIYDNNSSCTAWEDECSSIGHNNRYLVSQSRRLLSTALLSTNENKDNINELMADKEFWLKWKPLHRYTEVRPVNARRVGVLTKQQHIADGRQQLVGGILGEDLFATTTTKHRMNRYQSYDDSKTDNCSDAHESSRSSNVGGNAKERASLQAWKDWNAWVQQEKEWEQNELTARPPKEDPLWIRKGDESKHTSFKDQVAAAYRNIFFNNQYDYPRAGNGSGGNGEPDDNPSEGSKES